MLTVRLAGAVLLMVSSVALGFCARMSEKKRIGALYRALELVQDAMRKIELFQMPLSAVFPPDESGKEDEGTHLCEAMGRDGDILRDFLARIGQGYREETLGLCRFTCDTLEARIRIAEGEYPARAKLYTALPLLVAVSVIVLIL